MAVNQDQCAGCLLGLALGDALGAPYEGGPIERGLWRFIGTTRTGEIRWTDDTQMSLDLAESLLAKGALDPDDIAARFAKSYRWSRGYGQKPFRERLEIAREWLGAGREPPPNEVVKRLGRSIAASESCVTGVYLGLRFIAKPFADLHRFVAACRGDADTIGAMSGAIWGAANGAGALPEKWLQKLEQRARLESIAEALYRAKGG